MLPADIASYGSNGFWLSKASQHGLRSGYVLPPLGTNVCEYKPLSEHLNGLFPATLSGQVLK